MCNSGLSGKRLMRTTHKGTMSDIWRLQESTEPVDRSTAQTEVVVIAKAAGGCAIAATAAATAGQRCRTPGLLDGAAGTLIGIR